MFKGVFNDFLEPGGGQGLSKFLQILEYKRFLRGRLHQYKWTECKKTVTEYHRAKMAPGPKILGAISKFLMA
uniref:Uncharacterized protein n=1 Tax=Romanomermis culicivorax TaxID=13658 RepID=A0A915J744_ROMCU